ncbi:acetyl-CoA C-acetyltransferase [Steroidobacter sp.]|uniref:acetyl-CoA C-acetyltransferase n=1 Tax=Steroidobacter sp. TaxID=1978227 RepID=UPI001A636DE3|nr:acetyl-CoA C-acetyltransferase [Steroidobacter sp.]MBL8270077.1 acetyl-CoA C-acetyltransferase [Steroidobacter sp.]
MHEAYIYDHVRTPRGKGRPDGGLHEITPIQLATQTLEALRGRNRLDTALIEDVILGCVSPVGEQGADIARVAAINAGYAQEVPGVQLNRFCASGLDAVNLAAAKIAAGHADALIAGGVESMSRVAMSSDGGAWSNDPQVAWKSYFTPQGIGADLIATLDGHSRTDIDALAVESQRRATHAWANGYFDRSIVPVRDLIGQVLCDRDEHLRPGTSLESLATLKPAFTQLGEDIGFDAVALQRYPQVERIRHIHTGGNSSGIVDGAASVLIGSREFGRAAGLKPRARIRACASIGSEPAIMLTGPAACSRRALQRAGMSVRDIDLFEINEAFASVVLRYRRELELSADIVNVNGGSIALGHPLGATGAMLVGTVLDELERRNLNTALITLCAAAGQATATIIERV